MSDLVTILSFRYLAEAEVARGFLISEGIHCYLKDEMINQVGYYSNAIGGVKIQVASYDYEKALEVLRESRYHKFIIGSSPESESGLAVKITKAFGYFDHKTKFLPIIGNLSVLVKITILIILICAVASFVPWLIADLSN